MASLVSEVSPHVLINHTIKSAEQAFYGQKTVYLTPNLNQASTSSASEKPSDKKTTKKSESESDEVMALRKQVSQLTLDKEQLTKEVAELRTQLQKLLRLKSLFDLGSHILILGDGNLSFTLALARCFPAKRIVGSVLESSEEEFFARYGSGADTLRFIRHDCQNAVVRFGVDATQLSRQSFVSSPFSDILMNFPHHCGKTNIRRSRRLLHDVFESVTTELMTVGLTRLHITLAQGQSGLCEEEVTEGMAWLPADGRLPRHRSDSWQAVYLAAECGLRLADARIFDPADFPGYVCAGYLNREQRFHNENTAVTLSFTKAYELSLLPSIDLSEARRIESNKDHLATRPDGFHPFRPFFVRDLSVLYDAALVGWPAAVDLAEKDALTRVHLFADPLIVRLVEVRKLRTVFDGRPNRIYRIYWQGDWLPLHKALVNRLHDELCRSGSTTQPAAIRPAAAAGSDKAADEDFDLFGSDDEEESEEQKRIREERLSAYAAKKAKKPGPIAKSSVIIDVKPWDDETDLKKMEECVRSIVKDGLLWGASKLIPVGYGIQKLQIVSTIEDEKISVDVDLVEFIQEEFADYVQSVDIVAFNKI